MYIQAIPPLLATQYRTFPSEVEVVDKWQIPGFRYAASGGYSTTGAGATQSPERERLNHRNGRLVVAHLGGDDAAAHLVDR